MSLDAIVREGVAIAKTVTNSLQAMVTHKQWIRFDAHGRPVYDEPVLRQALVEKQHRLVRGTDGREVMVSTYLAFLEPIAAHGAVGRHEPIDERDQFILPDQSTGPIVVSKGLIDASTGAPYLTEVWLG